MADVYLKFIGFRHSPGRETAIYDIGEETTVLNLFESLRKKTEPGSPGPGSQLAAMDRDGILTAVNGKLVNQPGHWERVLVEGDTVTFMTAMAGG